MAGSGQSRSLPIPFDARLELGAVCQRWHGMPSPGYIGTLARPQAVLAWGQISGLMLLGILAPSALPACPNSSVLLPQRSSYCM